MTPLFITVTNEENITSFWWADGACELYKYRFNHLINVVSRELEAIFLGRRDVFATAPLDLHFRKLTMVSCRMCMQSVVMNLLILISSLILDGYFISENRGIKSGLVYCELEGWILPA